MTGQTHKEAFCIHQATPAGAALVGGIVKHDSRWWYFSRTGAPPVRQIAARNETSARDQALTIINAFLFADDPSKPHYHITDFKKCATPPWIAAEIAGRS